MDRQAFECKPNKYGYKLNVNHPAVRPLYERFKRWKGIPDNDPPSDEERKEFEDYAMPYLTKRQIKKSARK